MPLDENEINRYLRPLFGRYEDSFQEAWVEILEAKPHTVDEITPIARKVKNRAIRRYLEKKHKEESLQRPLGNNGDEKFTLESILASPQSEADDESAEGSTALYRRMVDFLIGECSTQRNENRELKRRQIELKAQRLRLRAEWLNFKKDRFESWKRLMEEKGRQKENLARLRLQLQREKLEFRREQLLFEERAREGL
jgi:hypothetical protein